MNIDNIFKNLNYSDKQLLINNLSLINKKIQSIYNYNIDNEERIILILNSILPYSSKTIYDKIVDLNEIYTNSLINLEYTKIDKEDILKKNVEIYLKILDITRHKIYVNFIEIYPIQTFDKNLSIYKNTIYNDGLENNDKGLYIGDIYNTISFNLYNNVRNIKWLLYIYNNKTFYEIINKEDNVVDVILNQRENFIEYSKILIYFFEEDYVPDAYKESMIFKEAYNKKNENIIKQILLKYANIINYYIKKSILKLESMGFYKDILTEKHNCKFVYNFAKSILIKLFGINELKNKAKWEELNDNEKSEFLNILKKTNNNDWYNITNVLNIINYNEISKNIAIKIKENLIEYVMKIMIHKKILTEVKNKMSDNEIIINYENSENPITKKKHFTTENFITTNKKINIRHQVFNKDIFKLLKQIDFYNHYLNNILLFITGETGQGKSTLVPILIYYSSYVYDYTKDVKIKCTQPRHKPVEDNYKKVLKNLNIDLNKDINELNKEELEEYHNKQIIQYQHKDDESFLYDIYKSRYIILNESYNKKKLELLLNVTESYLRFVTDGLLLNELYEENQSTYNVIIVDEVHEHNTNMDMILTLFKEILTVNKKIKLILISATLDNDEKRYRLFYNNKSIVDKRFNITPLIGREYNVKPIYNNLSKDKSYQSNEELGIQELEKLCKNTKEGNILFFSIGEYEIKELYNKLLKILPDNILILPYYTNIEESWKEEITKINLKEITFKRDKIMENYKKDYEERDIGNYKYSRFVIIATNIAEASITINNLTYIIETGWEKSNKLKKMDYIIINPTLEISKISEVSRIQREGRVGRVSNGICYYTYPKNNRMKIKTKYKIENEMFLPYIFSLILYFNNKKKIYIKNKMNTSDIVNKILDITGNFYIIHPMENDIERNEKTKIIKYDDKYKKYMLSLINLLIRYQLIDDNLEQTNFGENTNNYGRIFNITDLNYKMLMVYGKKNNVFEEIVHIVNLLEVINNNIKNFIDININVRDSEVLIIYYVSKILMQYLIIYDKENNKIKDMNAYNNLMKLMNIKIPKKDLDNYYFNLIKKNKNIKDFYNIIEKKSKNKIENIEEMIYRCFYESYKFNTLEFNDLTKKYEHILNKELSIELENKENELQKLMIIPSNKIFYINLIYKNENFIPSIISNIY